MEIRRVIVGGLATLAAGATFALGAGAVTLGDFVQVSGNTMTSPYIVIGGNAKAEDTLAAADIGVALAGQATESVAVSGSQASMSVTNGAMLETASRKLYLGEAFSNTNIKPTFLAKDLPELLKSGVVEQDNGDEIDYSQYLKLGGQTVTFDRDSDWDDPALYVDLVDGANLYTYEIIFSQGLVNTTDELGDQEIELLGVPYVFSDVEGEIDGTMLTLFGAGQTETVSAGSSTTVSIGSDEYVITVVGVGENNDAVIDINGEQFDVDTDAGGEVDISKDDLNIHVKAIRAVKFPVESGSVQMFIGSEKMVLENGQGVVIGEEEIDGTAVTIDVTDKISKITVTYEIQDDDKLLAGESVEDPVFSAFNIALGGIYPELDDDSKDVVAIEKNSENVELTFTNKDGDEYSMAVLSLNDTIGGLDLSDGNENIRVYNNATLNQGDFVFVTTGEYSYILEYTDYTSDDEAILTDVSTGSDYTITASTDFIYPGESGRPVSVTGFVSETVTLNNTGEGVNTLAVLYAEHGANITVAAVNRVDGGTNTTYPLLNATGVIYVTDNTFETTDDVAEATVKVTCTEDDDEVDQIAVTSVVWTGGTETMVTDDAGDYKYGVAASGTYVVENVDDEIVTVYTPEEPSAVYVAVGEDPEFVAGGVSGGTVQQAVQIKNSISKMEAEIDTATLSRDLVLIGGPCANGLVAELLGMSATNPTCATDFTAQYPTEGVITVVDDAFNSGQKALVVAGVNRQKTRDLAVKVMQGTVDYDA